MIRRARYAGLVAHHMAGLLWRWATGQPLGLVQGWHSTIGTRREVARWVLAEGWRQAKQRAHARM
jgi:hypothetical protein